MVVDPFFVEANSVFLALDRAVEIALGLVGSPEPRNDRVSRKPFAHGSKLSGKGHLCCAMCASKSARNCVKKARADHAHPSASAQIHLPSMKLQQSARVCRSCATPSPRSIRVSVL